MAGSQIVSASVGDSVAGGLVISEPVYASYATYPDITPKSGPELRQIFLQNFDRLLNKAVDKYGKDDPPVAPQRASGPQVAGFGIGALVVIGLIVFLVVKVIR
jgi:hypothetical protein